MSEILDEAAVSEIEASGLDTAARLSHQEDTSMTKNYDDFRAGMLRAAEMARSEFKRAPEATKGHDCVYMGGYEDACDHLSVVIAQAAVIDCVRVAGSQPDWQYHIALLLPDGAVEDQALLKIYQVVEHELGLLQSQNERLQNLVIPDSISDLARRIDAAIRFTVPIQQQAKLRSYINELITLNGSLRSRAIQLCKAKAAEWAKQSEEAQARGIQVVADGKASRALAAKELATELEKL